MRETLDIRSDTELLDVARLFYGDEVPMIDLTQDGSKFTVSILGKDFAYVYDDPIYDAIPDAHKDGRLSKIALYDALKACTGREMPWGALTGVRPSKLFYENLRAGKTDTEAAEVMQSVYRVKQDRALVLRRIVYSQRGKIDFPCDNINLYVHIPYCTTRCTYCSFVSVPIEKYRSQSTEYVALLSEEIKRSVEFLEQRGKNILSVYVGGGTPTSLSAKELDTVLSAIGNVSVEYTVEAGRPDTIDDEKADILKAHGVTRVCVNPQTLCKTTLEKIGRRHSVEDFYTAYEIMRRRGFDINCDLIAGLADETAEDFAASFEGIKALAPQNITVHSLSKKNGSAIRFDPSVNRATEEMIEYALNNIGEYRPYYLYRQKRQAGNLENIGFSVKGKECVNNITTMEETVGVMACGAGAISKFIGNGNIARYANLRDVPLYLNKFGERVTAKLDFFDEQYDIENK